MAQFTMEMPPSVNGSADAIALRKYLARLVDRLMYTLNNIDDENLLGGSISLSKLKGGEKGVANAAVANMGQANVGTASIQHVNAQVAEIITAVIKTAVIDWAKVTNMEVTKEYVEDLKARYANIAALETAIANIADARIAEAQIDQADIEMLKAYAAQIVQAEIQTAEIDWAKLKHMVADEVIVARFVGDRMYIDHLGVSSAQVVDLTVNSLCLKAANGSYYTLSVDTDVNSQTYGQVTATLRSVSAEEIAAGITSDRKAIVETELTANQLNAQNILAAEALVRHLTAERIDVDTLFARQATIDQITSGTIASELGHGLDLTSNTSIIGNVTASEEWQCVEDYMQETDNTIAILRDAISARVTTTQMDTNNQVISERISQVELAAGRAETSVQNLTEGIGTHLIVEEDMLRITQDQNGDWEQQLFADRLQFVNTRSGKVAASFGVNGGRADRLQSDKTLSVGQTKTGWYDMTSLESGVADKWRDGTETVLAPILTTQPADCLLEWQSGTHPMNTTSDWSETATFACTAENATGYQWQYRYGDHDEWRNSGLTGYNTDTLGPFAVNSAWIGCQWRCKVTGAGGAVITTRTAQIRFPDGPAAVRQPQSAEANANESVTLTVKALGAGLQWQSKSAETGAWADLSGETGESLTVTAASTAYYRCVLTDSNGRVGCTRECRVEV